MAPRNRYVRTSLKINGLEQLMNDLNQLPDNVQVRVFKSGLRKTLDFLIEKVKAQVLAVGAYATGNLYRAITATRLYKGRRRKSMIISQVYPKKVPYAHLVEKGFKHTSGKHVPANSFLLKTAEEQSQAVVDQLSKEMSPYIERALKKLHKQYGRK
ncbi:hypothetical protein EKK58_02015 [Candidatus Dependentiae bacterium]|nr:MAG: hypothetical protein EKK58_02015 [Candidatus Dependentiae bacterium]